MSSDDQMSVALVGHCGPDMWMLKSMVERVLPGVDVVINNDADELDQALSRVNLLLVNRVLDGRFKSESGIELIRECASRDGAPPLMLISNFEEAQSEAESAGAVPGFGKAETNSEEAASRIRDAVGVGT